MRFYPRVSPDLGGGKQIHFKIKRSLDRSLDIALRVVTWVTSWDGAISLWSALGRISVGYFGLNGHTVVRRPFHWLTGYPVTGLVHCYSNHIKLEKYGYESNLISVGGYNMVNIRTIISFWNHFPFFGSSFLRQFPLKCHDWTMQTVTGYEVFNRLTITINMLPVNRLSG